MAGMPASASSPDRPPAAAPASRGSVAEVFWIFLRLGLTSFGGPVAHLGYFREAFVERRRWLSDRAYADLVALCQFLPGPASSQVGMALGLKRAGFAGMLAAWVAFTLPSALALAAFGFGIHALGDLGDAGWLTGLKVAAVAVVAHAVLGMARSLTPDAPRASIAVAALAIALLVPTAWAQVAAIVLAGIIGLVWLRPAAPEASGASVGQRHPFRVRVPMPVAAGSLILFAVLLIGLPVITRLTGSDALQLADVFYRAGALVFGGGHVVLPLLQAELVPAGIVSNDAFLAGYGAAQAVPGPLFTFAAYLGTVSTTSATGAVGAAIALGAVFLPAALLVIGTLPLWQTLSGHRLARRALSGVNAGVVGILAAALYHPVFTTGITSPLTLVIGAAAFVALSVWKAPAWAVVAAAGLLGLLVL